MEYRTLGRTGLEVSILGQGGFHLLEINPLALFISLVYAFIDSWNRRMSKNLSLSLMTKRALRLSFTFFR